MAVECPVLQCCFLNIKNLAANIISVSIPCQPGQNCLSTTSAGISLCYISPHCEILVISPIASDSAALPSFFEITSGFLQCSVVRTLHDWLPCHGHLPARSETRAVHGKGMRQHNDYNENEWAEWKRIMLKKKLRISSVHKDSWKYMKDFPWQTFRPRLCLPL